MMIRPADLILVRGQGIIADFIEGVTHSPYSHLAGLAKPNELIEAQGFRRTGYQGLDFYAGCADVFTCDLLTDEQRAQIVANVTQYVGTRYSYPLLAWELVRYVTGVIILPGVDWQPIICSTLWMRSYRSVGVDPCPGKLFPTPGDVAESKMFRYAGSI